MKRIPILFALAVMLALSACANLERNAYRTIGTIITTVNGAMDGWRDYVHAGKATPVEQAKVKEIYHRYLGALGVAEAAVDAYYDAVEAKLPADRPRMLTALRALSS